MFDFSRWSKFVEARSIALRGQGFEVAFRGMEAPVPKATVDIKNTNILAAFYFWDTGFADYDVMDSKTNCERNQQAVHRSDFRSTFWAVHHLLPEISRIVTLFFNRPIGF